MTKALDIDLSLVSSLLSSDVKTLRQIQGRGVRVDMMADPKGQLAYEHLLGYVDSYGVLPSRDIVEAKAGVVLPDQLPSPLDFYVDAVLDRGLHYFLSKSGVTIAKHLEDARPRDALDCMESSLREARRQHTYAYSQVDSIPALFADVLTYYDKIKNGERGILTPWPTVNEETLGFWPEDLAVFVARTGVGKTWVAALIALCAWQAGHRVLFGTTEISKLRVAMRFAALHFKVPYKLLRRGMLDAFQELAFRKGVQEILDAEGLKVIGGDFDFRPESYEAAIISVAPALGILDGAYLLQAEGHTRTEKAANAFDELKRICKRTAVPNVVTMQFNREVKQGSKSSGMDAGKIALTDVAGWNGDLIYGLVQTEDMKKNRRMIFKPLKVREGEGEEFEVNWDIDENNFSELPRDNQGDQWGTGAAADVDVAVPF